MRQKLDMTEGIFPMPVLMVATYNEDGSVNVMNAAWGTVCDTAQVAIVLSAGHKTVKNLLKTGAFTVSLADSENVVAADYVGVTSANDTPDKLKATGWHIQKSAFVNAPIIEELPFTLECKLVRYDEESETCVGEVVNVNADERILNANGGVDLTKFHPICYDCFGHGYYELGKKVGQAFSDGLILKK